MALAIALVLPAISVGYMADDHVLRASLRVESRVPGADCNPYLAYAAALHSGLDGIANHIEPPTVFEGDVYQAAHLPHVPKTLADAIPQFESSEFARAALGSQLVDVNGQIG